MHFHASVLSPATLYIQTSRGQDFGSTLKPPTDIWTAAGVAKMLIKDSNKISSKDLKKGWQERVLMLSSPLRHLPTLNLAQMSLFPTRSHSRCATSPPPSPHPALSCGGGDGAVGVQDRQLREAIFLKKIQRHIKEEQAVYIKW